MPNQAGSVIIFIVMEIFPKVKQQKIWQIKAPFPALQHVLAHRLGISSIVAQLLINRGIYTAEQGYAFFHSGLEKLYSPHLLKDMDAAVRRITSAARAKEKILVYGDFDADGITATVLLVRVIRGLGGMVDYYIPNRLEYGYGLHLDILRRYREKGVSLVITVDCGVSSLAEADWARENGLDLIITDHHEPPPVLPRAPAVINPKRPDCPYPFKELAGVGVALKLAQALLEHAGAEAQAWQDYLDLTCLGTIADIVPLYDENRILVKHGLDRLAHTEWPGLQALLEVSGTSNNTLGASEVGFRLAPRLNAAGRIGDPELAVRLLLTDHAPEAQALARELHRDNTVRQEIEAKVLKESLALLERQPGVAEDKVMVLASAGWHPGVIGIVASRLTELFYRPVLLVSLADDRTGRGSARSIPGFNMYQALSHCREYLLTYGGHALAAGFTLAADKIEDFTRKINQYAAAVLDGDKMIPRLDIDGLITLNQVTEKLVDEINRMQPFGLSNPPPLLGCRKASVAACRGVGKESAHLKMRLRSGSVTVESIGFNLGAYAEVLATEETVDLAFAPGINEYQGRRSLQLKVKDVGMPAKLDIEKDFLNEYGRQDIVHHDRGLFVPEFIHAVVSGTGLAEPQTHFPGAPEAPPRQLFVDLRESAARQMKLGELLADECPAIVLTACAAQTIEISYYLQLSYPSLKGKVACCHGAMSAPQLEKNAARFGAGAVKVLIATPAAAGALNLTAGRVVFYHLPFSQGEFNLTGRVVKPDGRVYLFFNTFDLENNISWLAATAPDRNCLAAFYTLLRRSMNGRGVFTLAPAQAARMLADSGYPYARECTVHAALQVFQEIDLLQAAPKGAAMQITMLPAPGQKQDLHRSPAYLSLRQIREASTAWMTKALREPVNNLL